MLNSAILEVGIGLILVYLVFGLVCAAINEQIARMFTLRAETLWAGIRSLLTDGPGTGLARNIYNHDIIRSLSLKEGSRTSGQTDDPWDRDKPSYIPSRLFVLALLDQIAKGASQVVTSPPGAPSSVSDLLSQLQDSNVPQALKDTLRPLIQEAGDDLGKARKNVEAWYDAGMERASGWYKQKVQLIIITIAIIVTFATNADSLMIANRLFANPAERERIVAEAGKYSSASASAASAALPKPVSDILGWSPHRDISDPEFNPADPRALPNSFGGWLTKLAGILLTAFAASLGAPFWFDVLGKITNLRPGKPQADIPAPKAAATGESK